MLSLAFLLAAVVQAPSGGGSTSRPPPGNFADYISSSDYPGGALADGAEGTVGFVVTVAPSGRVSDCSITRSSGYSSLDIGTCRLARRRLRFNPARDPEGRPVAARSREFRITWQMGGGPDAGDRRVRQRPVGEPVGKD